ncbi:MULTISPECIES: SRPBCC family protein [unclassified Streptomyces]|uniref:SRPBCC family protein n=1 Tax=unclassified Streptomyces TaxID=2593676 RepID=UPI0008852929|nr:MULTISPECIES: SRPBCC family protein [unclassified Streptomyces]PBC80672.1 polyketide cyclase/dehydrase/lipid transport protein [Streptomyces sp. 2321.6]SDR57693.1 Polyketide cyclase / dehydrase and lipid transport [Streptomyces sp. KS_16]SEB83994.1 Polyketide cyclase / dehydrase and lipid transport [Streptomyces sp. 2133.1]SNC61586.1 Polyketide cyclase / dehydrase and lipid transport [Streptomyces sp. 2114.4]
MAESTFSKIKDEVTKSPAADQLKEELQHYLQARAEHAVTSLGHKLGESVGKLAEPGQGAGGLVSGLAKGGKALGEGKPPQQAALTAGASHLKDTVKDKVKSLFGKGRKGGGGKSKSVTIVEDIDVGVPVREAYDQWTQFQEFSTFAKGVVSVDKADDTSSNWKVKVAKSTRSWRANVTQQVPDERISWTTEGAKGTVKGVVTFHRLTDNLTRVLLVLEYFPKGLFEKTGNIWRAQGRRARLDLKLYRKFIMLRGEATDGWRGEIQDGEVVVEHDDAVAAEEDREDTERGSDEVRPGDDEADESDEADETDADAEDEDEEEDEEDEDEEDEGEGDPEDAWDAEEEGVDDPDGLAEEAEGEVGDEDDEDDLEEPVDEHDHRGEPLHEDDAPADDREPYDEDEPSAPRRGRRAAVAR